MATNGSVVKKDSDTTRWHKSHIRADDNELSEALNAQEINAELYTQAANSPDVNLLDLGFFRPIQSFNDMVPKNEEQ